MVVLVGEMMINVTPVTAATFRQIEFGPRWEDNKRRLTSLLLSVRIERR